MQAARTAAALNMRAVSEAAHDVRTALLSGVPPGSTPAQLPDLAPYAPPGAAPTGTTYTGQSSSFAPHPNTVYMGTGGPTYHVPLAQPPLAFQLSHEQQATTRMPHGAHGDLSYTNPEAGGAGEGATASPAAVRAAALRAAAWRLFKALDSGPVAAAVWRTLVAAYYVNLAYEQVGAGLGLLRSERAWHHGPVSS